MKYSIRDRRQEAGLTQRELAEKAGCTRQFINMLEAEDQDFNISTDLLVNLADALHCSTDDLILRSASTKVDSLST